MSSMPDVATQSWPIVGRSGSWHPPWSRRRRRRGIDGCLAEVASRRPLGLRPHAALIETDALTKRYPAGVTALDALTLQLERRDHRAGRSERRRQEHAAAHPARAAGADLGPCPRPRPGRPDRRARAAPVPRLHARVGLPAARHERHRLRRPDGPAVRAARHRRPRASRRGAPPRRPVRGALSTDGRLLDRHEAAGQARPGAGPRSAPAAARRADQRPRPGRPRRDARPGPPDRHGVRDRGHRGQPPARRDRAGVRLPRRHRRRASSSAPRR